MADFYILIMHNFVAFYNKSLQNNLRYVFLIGKMQKREIIRYK